MAACSSPSTEKEDTKNSATGEKGAEREGGGVRVSRGVTAPQIIITPHFLPPRAAANEKEINRRHVEQPDSIDIYIEHSTILYLQLKCKPLEQL